MSTTGQKIVCINSDFPAWVKQFYTALPVKDVVYVVRWTTVGVSPEGQEGEICVYLVGLVNPCSSVPPYRERGFNAERFRPLEEMESVSTVRHTETITEGAAA